MAFFPNYYDSSDIFRPKTVSTAADRYKVVIPPLQVRIGTISLESYSNIEMDCSNAAHWDTDDPTDYTVAADRAGKDFYLYAVAPTIGKTPKILLSANATYPDGYTADNSRKVGGFHCLCVNVGTISGHTLTNYLAGDILPASVWCLKHRAINHNNAGMAYDDDTQNWYMIYLASLSGSTAISAYGGTISDTVTWFNTVDYCANGGTRLLSDDEFSACANGSPEGTNITGSADPVTTGGHVDTAGRRIISNIGCEDCTGVMWHWLDEQSYRFDAAAAHTHSLTASGDPETINTGTASADVAPAFSYKAQTGGKGSLYTQGTYGTTKLIAGGFWPNGATCGSRSRRADGFPWLADSTIGFRAACKGIKK